jgi:DNA invertase Pin-like site-specific DNA recombinase
MQNVIGYVRASTNEQHIGPEAQKESIKKWCDDNDARLIGIFEDLGISGGAPLNKRPGLLDAIEQIKKTKGCIFLIAKRDRLARDVILSAMIERLVDREKSKIISIDGAGNGAGPEAQLMRRMIDAFAEYERSIIKARTSSAMQTMRKKHLYTGGSVRYGYRTGTDGRLSPVKSEQNTIERAREIYSKVQTLKGTADILNKEGFRSRTGKNFQAVQIKNMLAA